MWGLQSPKASTGATSNRHDESDTKKVVAHVGNYVHGQDTLATELIYAF